jgi:hypothetical protein
MQDWFDSNDPRRRPDHGGPVPPMPLPSIFDLARHAEAASLRADLLGKFRQQPGDDDEKLTVLHDREEALRGLLLTFRATTLSDAAASLYAGFCVADYGTCRDVQPGECARDYATLRRVFLSTLPVVAEAAGIDLALIGADYIAGYAAREFPAEA